MFKTWWNIEVLICLEQMVGALIMMDFYDIFQPHDEAPTISGNHTMPKRLARLQVQLHCCPPVNKHSNGKSPSWIGNTSSNGGFSIAMLDYRSVPLKFNSSPLKSYLANSKVVFQPPFSGSVLNVGRVVLYKTMQLPFKDHTHMHNSCTSQLLTRN